MDVYQAIAHQNRRRLFDLLSTGERSVKELTPHFDFTIGAVSQHLRILEASGLVEQRKEGRYRLYKARPEALKEIHEWTEQYRRFWESSLDRLGAYLDKQP